MKKLLTKLMLLTIVFSSIFTYKVFALEKLKTTLTYEGKQFYYENYAMELFVNGEPLYNLPMEPILLNSRTYVPLRAVFESMGAIVDWKPETQQIYIAYGDELIMMQIGSKTMRVGSKTFEMEVPPLVINNRTMVPVRFAAEALNFSVVTDWTTDHRYIYINSPEYNQPTPSAPTPTPPPYQPNPSLESSVDVSTQVLTEQANPETRVTGIELPTGSSQIYTIRTSSAMSRVEKMLLYDDRLVIDICNAEIAVPQRTFELAGNPFLAGIRAAQNQVTPEKITRIVFDISSPVHFSVSMTADRKSIAVAFETEIEMNTIQSVTFTSDGTSDYITVEGTTAPATSLFTLTNPNRLVIDMPLSVMSTLKEHAVGGLFAHQLRTGQFTSDTARVVLELRQNTSTSVTTEGNRTIIKLSQPTYRNIWYDASAKCIVINKAGMNLRASDIFQLDEYNKFRYTFTLPGDFSGSLGHGEYIVNDDLINSFVIQSTNNATRIIVQENRVLAFEITENATSIFIRAMLPSEKYDYIVVIDPGHGGEKPGTSGFGIVEKDINLDISLKLIALLNADGRVKVYSTRVEDVNITLSERAKFANDVGDLFVSIHNNAIERPNISGTEMHYYAHANDAVIGISCKNVATIIQKHLVSALGFIDRKLFSSDFQVLRETEIPAVLAEIGFLTNPEENAKLATQEYRIRAAQALFDGIMEVFSVYTPAR